MARTDSPLLSLGARGAIGKSIVFGEWRGVKYARTFVVPSNPDTVEQGKTRGVFSYASSYWKMSPADAKLPWNEYAKGRKFLGRNAMVGQNIESMRGDANNNDLVGSPGVKSGPVLASVGAISGTPSGSIDLTAGLGTIPNGWTTTRVVWLLARQQDPMDSFIGQVVVGEDATTPYAVTVTGLTAGQIYVITAFAEYTTDKGQYAAGPSLNTTATAKA